ncbi:MAG: PHP domain-containing protein [Acidimicrobiia bacterium]
MAVDLHLHSTASDGADAPDELMRLAREAGATTVALTDHDTFAGISEASAAASDLGLGFIPGVELSVDHRGHKMHMLVYFVDDSSLELRARLDELRDGRTKRNDLIIEKLNNLGYAVTIEDVRRHAKGPSVGRPHIADALIEKGYIETRDEAFVDLLQDGGAVYVERTRLTAEDAIGIARREGGVPVIAHPATITATSEEYSELFSELTDIGLGGIEAHHSMHTIALRNHLTDVAGELGIAATGGSDYHGASKREYRIATGVGDLRVPDQALSDLDVQRAR